MNLTNEQQEYIRKTLIDNINIWIKNESLPRICFATDSITISHYPLQGQKYEVINLSTPADLDKLIYQVIKRLLGPTVKETSITINHKKRQIKLKGYYQTPIETKYIF